jgi:ABC-type nitrate/sulfonate/bicarbonate transport system ATPase subunit
VIRLRGLAHTYDGNPPVAALEPLDLDIADGQITAVIGRSGCGKSTLLRILAGLVEPTAGHVDVGPTAYQPQRDALLPWRRVLANATLGAEVSGVPADQARADAVRLLDQFGLAGFERSWPRELSGGMRQRVALLRTFLVPRPVLLLDEPFGALDAITRAEMQSWLEAVWQADGRTVVLVTHDVEETLRLADRVVVLSPRPGRVVLDLAVTSPRPRDVTAPELVELKRTLLHALLP